jgi:hypothetical protein
MSSRRRRTRVARALRYGSRCGPRRRVLLRVRGRALRYRGPWWAFIPFAVLLAATVVAAVLTSALVPGIVVGALLTVGYLAYALRLVRMMPAGPSGGPGFTPPGGAGVREPRRPLPQSPAGAAARSMEDRDEDPPGRAVALA